MDYEELFDVDKIITSSRNNSLSYRYDRYDVVESIHVKKETENYDISATTDVLGRVNHCHFYVNLIGEIYDYECDCGFCDEESPCAHIGAVLLKLNDLNPDSYPYDYKKDDFYEIERKKREELLEKRRMSYLTQEANDFIKQRMSRYMNEIQSHIQEEVYQIMPVLNTEFGELSISYKVGNSKKYVIKNIPAFIEQIENKEEVKYGKNLSFVHSYKAFDSFALKQIEFMKEAVVLEEKEYSSYYNNTIRREIYLRPYLLDSFFDLYEDYEFENCGLIDSSHPFTFGIQKEKYAYRVILEEEGQFTLGYRHIYRVDDEYCIVRFPGDGEGKMNELVRNVDEGLFVSFEDINDFMKYVISPLQNYIKIVGDVSIEINEYQTIKLYGDIDNQSRVCFQLYYVDEDLNRIPAFNNQIQNSYEQDFVEKYLESKCDMRENNYLYFDMNSEKTYQFVHEDLEKIKEYCEVYVSEALKKLGKSTNYSLTVGMRISHNLLELDLDSVEIPKMEIASVLEHYRKKKKYYRLKNGELLYLESDELKDLSTLLDQYQINTKDIKKGHVELDKNRAFSLDDMTKDVSNIQFERHSSFNNLISNFNQITKKYPLSAYYDHLLRDYQKEGYQWLRTLNEYGFNGILADDMGLGKTLQVIALLDELHLDKPALVVCPASLVYNWQDEVEKFSQNLKVKCIVGQQNQRIEDIKQYHQYNLFVTSYDYMRSDYKCYENNVYSYIILDESQYIKNQKTRNAMSVKTLKAEHKLALSGTPIENTLAELWSVFDFLMPYYLFNYHYFKTHFESHIVKEQDEQTIQQLQKLVSPFILRRNKKDVLKELPDKIEKTQIIPFNESERELYFANLSQANKELQELLKAQQIDKIAILALITRLRQICSEPRMLYDNIEQSSSKMKACIELISHYKENHQPVLLFSTFISVFEYMEEELRLNGISYLILTGQTSKEKRKEYVDRFQKGDIDVFLISLRAGGTGLTLTKAQAVIHFDPWWNMSAQNQATDRAYRIGQYHNVVVHQLIMKESIEEKIIQLQAKKKELSDLFVETSQGNITSLSKDDILSLFAKVKS